MCHHSFAREFYVNEFSAAAIFLLCFKKSECGGMPCFCVIFPLSAVLSTCVPGCVDASLRDCCNSSAKIFLYAINTQTYGGAKVYSHQLHTNSGIYHGAGKQECNVIQRVHDLKLLFNFMFTFFLVCLCPCAGYGLLSVVSPSRAKRQKKMRRIHP